MSNLNNEMLSSDDFQKYVIPTVSTEEIECIIANTYTVFKPVCRYMWPNINIDFELMTAIDYSNTINDSELKNVIAIISSNRNKYCDEELLYLLFRSMFFVVWKLDVLFLTHLEQCALVNYRWNQSLIYFSKNKVEGNLFALKCLPYWLRNTSLNYAFSLPSDLQDIYKQIEIVMIKADDIQAKCKLIGKTYIITLDCGIYIYLQEWSRLLLQGYRLKQYCSDNDWVITEPVKTGAKLLLSIVNNLRGDGSVFQMPAPAMNFKQNDQIIVREIVESQIEFIIGHELGHIVKHINLNPPYNKCIELEADDFSLDILKYSKGIVAVLNKADMSIKLPFEENDVQSKELYEKKVESVEILFAFYDMFYYICQRKYEESENTTHPELKERRENVCKRYTNGLKRPFIDYVYSLVYKIKEQIDNLLNENKGENNEDIL